MTPERLVEQLRSLVIQKNCEIYKEIFSSTSPEESSDIYWKKALHLYGSLDDDNRQIFFEIIRQVAVDTMSNIFGILDGSIGLAEGSTSISLVSEPDHKKINGDLQDILLEQEELGWIAANALNQGNSNLNPTP